MADRRDRPGPRPRRTALRGRGRRRWALVAGVAGLWLLCLMGTGSMTVATALLLVLAVIAGLILVALRGLGIDRDHPWVQRMAERPWRDGRDVLELALRHLPEVFIVTPGGALLAPNSVDLRMNPDDFASLTEVMEPGLIDSWACEAYQSCLGEHGARLGADGPAEVRVTGDAGVPAGRYRLRQGRPVAAVRAPAAGPVHRAAGPVYRAGDGGMFHASDGRTRAEGAAGRALATDLLTMGAAPPVPALRLVTEGSAVQTRLSGARAGRGSAVELLLPEEPTVSRVHAEFTYRDGQWLVTGLGRNGLLVNERPVRGEQVVRDGDSIRWGTQPEALTSQVQIG